MLILERKMANRPKRASGERDDSTTKASENFNLKYLCGLFCGFKQANNRKMKENTRRSY